jgi:hypothetical protein
MHNRYILIPKKIIIENLYVRNDVYIMSFGKSSRLFMDQGLEPYVWRAMIGRAYSFVRCLANRVLRSI